MTKTFTITGPKTSRTLELNEDEMLQWNVIKISDYKSPAELISNIQRNIAEKELEIEASNLTRDNIWIFDKEDPFTDDKETEISIYGWELYRVFRDENKTILKIILLKDGYFLELINPNIRENPNMRAK